MLTLMDVLKLLAAGRKLPQEAHPVPTDEQIERLRQAEMDLMNKVFDQVGNDDENDPIRILVNGIDELADEIDWYVTTSILCMLFAQRYEPGQVPDLEGVGPDTGSLLKMFSIAAREMESDEGAWTIPLAMLASVGREDAQSITACAGFCAGIGVVSAYMGGPEGES